LDECLQKDNTGETWDNDASIHLEEVVQSNFGLLLANFDLLENYQNLE
jgi:hypothetical protein